MADPENPLVCVGEGGWVICGRRPPTSFNGTLGRLYIYIYIYIYIAKCRGGCVSSPWGPL